MTPISASITMVLIMAIFFILVHYPSHATAPKIGECNIYEQYYHNASEIVSLTLRCPQRNYTMTYSKGTGIYPFGTKEGFYESLSESWLSNWISSQKTPFLMVLSSLSLLLIVPAFAFVLFGLMYGIGWLLQKIPGVNKLNNKAIPEINKLMTSSKYSATFKKCPETKTIEIPLFKNVFMDYRTTKEFSKYLQKVEIKEHPFSSVSTKHGWKRIEGQKIKKYKKEHNIWLWKATFTFKEVPKKGFLEVRWK
jgi:hypothetical protein